MVAGLGKGSDLLYNYCMKTALQGLGVSPGRVQGKVKIIKSDTSKVKFGSGDILVTRVTTPAMVPLMAKAGAIVCDIGGMTSHPSIVSRELGIPCVVNTKKATTFLKSGMVIRVDGTKGTIEIVKA